MALITKLDLGMASEMVLLHMAPETVSPHKASIAHWAHKLGLALGLGYLPGPCLGPFLGLGLSLGQFHGMSLVDMT